MKSRQIGKITLLMCKNKWWSLTKQSPIIGLLPLMTFAAIISSFIYTYNSLYEFLSLNEELPSGAINTYIDNFANISYILVIILIFILCQLIRQKKVHNKSLQLLPIKKKDWKFGQLIPIFLLFSIVYIAFLLPILLVLINMQFNSLLDTFVIIILFTCTIVSAAGIGLLWQQWVHLLAKTITSHILNQSYKVFHSLLSILSIIFILFIFMITGQKGFQFFLSILSSSFFGEFVKNFQVSFYLYDIIKIICYLLLIFCLVWLSFLLENEWDIENNQGWLPLEKLNFPISKLFSIFILEIKRLARDFEHIAYIVISFLFFILIGVYINYFVPNNGSLVILFQQVMAFAIPEILMIFTLLSRGRDSDNKTLYSYLPISVSSYVLEKLLIYITLFPILAFLFYNLFLWISGFPTISTLRDIIYYTLYSIAIFTLAFLVGIVVPTDEKKLTNSLISVLLFLIVSIPFYLLIIKFMGENPLYYLVLFVIMFLIISITFASWIVKEGEKK